jgi:hypothetical protein
MMFTDWTNPTKHFSPAERRAMIGNPHILAEIALLRRRIAEGAKDLAIESRLEYLKDTQNPSSYLWGRSGLNRGQGSGWNDSGYLPAVLEEFITPPHSGDRPFSAPAPAIRSRPNNRKRTGIPESDGLTGVEPNPGPPKKQAQNRPLPKLKQGNWTRKTGVGGRNATYGNVSRDIFGGTSGMTAMMPASVGGRGSMVFRSSGMRNVNGTPAHIFTGMCAIQSVGTSATGVIGFYDAANVSSTLSYLNPRICCQNSNYSVPGGYCPIGVIAQAYRKFAFTKVKYHYIPTSASTGTSVPVAFAFEPELVTTSSLGTTVMAYANFEASMYGPYWSGNTLDVTKYLDRSKWYRGEINSNSYNATWLEGIQGTLMCAPFTTSILNTILGMICLEFELAVYELGPTEVSSAPTLSTPVPQPSVSPPTQGSGDTHQSSADFVMVPKEALRGLGL